MPPRKRKKSVGEERPVIATPAGASQYRRFLNTHIAPIATGQKKGKSITEKALAGWQEPPAGNQGEIINEVAKKFNSSAPLGISTATYKQKGASSSSNYWSNAENKPQLDLVPQKNIKDGPNPTVVAHELVHASDHQGINPEDRLNPLVWKNLQPLAKGKNFDEFGNSIKRIQDKIDVEKDFGENYPIDRNYIESDIRGATGNHSYKIPLTGGKGSAPDWPELFNSINSVVNSPPGKGESVPNQGFYLNRASEFPAFMSENLTRNWRANTAPNPLAEHEARFLHSTLGNMGTAYPVAEYPTINSHILARRNSLDRAYPGISSPSPSTPPTSSSVTSSPLAEAISPTSSGNLGQTPSPSSPFSSFSPPSSSSSSSSFYPPSSSSSNSLPYFSISSRSTPSSRFSPGGRVTGKNLLSRFKKHTRH